METSGGTVTAHHNSLSGFWQGISVRSLPGLFRRGSLVTAAIDDAEAAPQEGAMPQVLVPAAAMGWRSQQADSK